MVPSFDGAIGSHPELFSIVVEFVGIVPSRFYLRQTCRKICGLIPRDVYVEADAFAELIKRKLLNPEYLSLSHAGLGQKDEIKHVLEGIVSLKSRRHQISLLERSFCIWAVEDLARETRQSTLLTLEWIGWESGHDLIFHIAKAAGALSRHREEARRSDWNAFFRIRDEAAHSSIEFTKRLISEWFVPQEMWDWHLLINSMLLYGFDLNAIEYVARQSGTDITRDLVDQMYAIARSGHVKLMKEFYDYTESQRPDIVSFNLRHSFRGACRAKKAEMVRFLGDKIHSKLDMTALNAFISADAWECAKLAVLGVNGDSDIAVALNERLRRDVKLFQKCMFDTRFIDPHLGVHLIRALIEVEVDEAIIEAVVDRTRKRNPVISRPTFDYTISISYLNRSLAAHAGLLKWLISDDPALVQKVWESSVDAKYMAGGGLTLMGLCELCPTRLKNGWTGRIWSQPRFHQDFYADPLEKEEVIRADDDSDDEDEFEEWEFYFHEDPDEEEEAGEDNLGPCCLDTEWGDMHVDPIDLRKVADLKAFLLSVGADMNRWFTPSSIAVAVEHWSNNPINQSAVEFMLAHGALIDKGNEKKETALYLSAKIGNWENCKTLLAYGATVFKEDYSIPSAMIAAANPTSSDSRYNVPVLELLYEKAVEMPGFNIDRLDPFSKYRFSALHIAAQSSEADNVKFFLDRGANVDIRSGNLGLTPLMAAYRQTDDGVRKFLIDRGADLNARNAHGRTAFWTYCLVGCVKGCEQLIKSGADVTIPDNDGIAPIDIVRFICEYTKRLDERGTKALDICPYPLSQYDGSESCGFKEPHMAIRGKLEKIVGRARFTLAVNHLEFAKKYRIDTLVYLLK